MANTKINLDRQTEWRVLSLGTTSASQQALLTLNNGTAAISNVVLDVKGSQSIAWDLNLTWNLNITGNVNTTTVTNTNVADKTITVNDGGTTAGASGAGIIVEGDSNTVIGWITFDNALASKFSIGNGSTQKEIVDVSSIQTLTNKVIWGGQVSGNISGNAANVTWTVAVGNGGTWITSYTVWDILYASAAWVLSKLAAGTSGTVLTSNGAGVAPSYQSVTSTKYYRACSVTGTQDGSNKAFTLGASVDANSEMVHLNGQLLTPWASNDYTISGTTVTFTAGFTAPTSTDVIRIYGNY